MAEFVSLGGEVAFPVLVRRGDDRDLLHDFQRWIALRKSRPALRRGSFTVLHAEDDVFVYARQLGSETIVVALNVATGTRRVDIPLSGLVADGAGFEEVWAHSSPRAEAGALRSMEIAPRSGRIFATPVPSP